MPDETPTVLLKRILENLRSPEQLDEHPWINALFVQAHIADNQLLENKSPGYRLCVSVSSLFMEMLPGTPPKRGKRLDTRWGKFGILASQYFAPHLFGLPYPDSLRDAWGGIDRAILLCRFGERANSLSADEARRYRLVGDELDVAALSTISDWHVKGIKKLAKLIGDREAHLSQSQPPVIVEQETPVVHESNPVVVIEEVPVVLPGKRRVWLWGFAGWLLAVLLVAMLTLISVKAWKIYQVAVVVREDASALQGMISTPITIEKIKNAGPGVIKLRQDIGALRKEANPFLPTLAPYLGWVPEYGPDLVAAPTLLEFADLLCASLETGYQAITPFIQTNTAEYNPQNLTRLLVDAQPKFLQAHQELNAAYALRARLEGKPLSSRVQALLDRFDPIYILLDDGLTAATSLPGLLGASNDGPKTYMVLVQNEDELRPTGGFITSVGSFVVRNGNIFGMQFEEAGDLEDWALPYPDAPWQLVRYMNSPVLVLRDANWFPDYPTTVDWVEYLYAYNHKNTVDGVIAIDQQMLVAVLNVIGPISVEGSSTVVTADNVIEFMRQSKVQPTQPPANWYRKAFIAQIATAIVDRLLSGGKVDWRLLAEMGLRNLNERHILLKFDDPQVTRLLAKYGWDGAVRAGSGDFLLAVDTNVGFNKTNAVVSSQLSYDVDLTDLGKPTSNLVIIHTNRASTSESCLQFGEHTNESAYPIDYCYWNYLRVFVPSGTSLDSATPHAIPADWMILGEGVPARVDILPDEIPGVSGFGTMLVVPGGQSDETSFKFSLPATILNSEIGSSIKTYILKIQKQPGTIAVPVTVRIHLPASAKVTTISPTAVVEGQNVLIETDLRTDLNISVSFSIP